MAVKTRSSYSFTVFPVPKTAIPGEKRAFEPEIDRRRRGFGTPAAEKPLKIKAFGDGHPILLWKYR